MWWARSNNLQKFLSLSNSEASQPIRHTHTLSRYLYHIAKPPVTTTASQLSMRGPSSTFSNRSLSPASSQTYVELSSSHNNKTSVKSEHVMDLFSPHKVHSIPSSPREFTFPESPSREARTRSPLISPIKPRFHPYLKTRATAAATAQFAMKSLRGETAHELNPEAALMVSDALLQMLIKC